MKIKSAAFLLLGALAFGAAAQVPQRELIYGAELMSDEEREQYRRETREAKDEEARAAFSKRHRARIRERARERGAQLREPHGVLERPAKK